MSKIYHHTKLKRFLIDGEGFKALLKVLVPALSGDVRLHQALSLTLGVDVQGSGDKVNNLVHNRSMAINLCLLPFAETEILGGDFEHTAICLYLKTHMLIFT